VKRGQLMHYVPDTTTGTYVYFRYLPGHPTVMVVLNKGPDQALDLARFSERVVPGMRAQNVLTGASFTLGRSVTLPAREALVLELQTDQRP